MILKVSSKHNSCNAAMTWLITGREKHSSREFSLLSMTLVCPGLTLMNALPQTNEVLNMCHSQESPRQVALVALAASWAGLASHSAGAALLGNLSESGKIRMMILKLGNSACHGRVIIKGKIKGQREVMRVMFVMIHMKKCLDVICKV